MFWRLIVASVLLDRRNRLMHSCHELSREDDRGIFLGGNFGHGLECAQLKRNRMQRENICGLTELNSRLELPFCGNNLGAAFALCLRLLRHGTLHIFR